jgi:predicted GIY-YIG superfamily endonuclease
MSWWSDVARARYYEPGYVYIAGSLGGRVLKIGTTVNIGRRLETKLRGQGYGNLDDWKLLFYVWVQQGGNIEHAARRQLQHCKTMRMYRKDGSMQKGREIVRCSYSLAEAAIFNLITSEESSRVWRSANRFLYEF